MKNKFKIQENNKKSNKISLTVKNKQKKKRKERNTLRRTTEHRHFTISLLFVHVE